MAHSRKPPTRSPAKRSAKAMACIEARGLRKAFGTTVAVDGIDLRVEEGRILGLIGPNGAGRTTALNAILGLTSYQGELRVLGRDPWTEREKLMRDACFIADVAVLPRWMRVWQALDYFAGGSEEHTSELQSHSDLVCRLLLEKKKEKKCSITNTKQ